MERVREDCDIKHREQGYLHREEVWGRHGGAALLALALVVGVPRGVTLAGRRVRRLIREEIERAGREDA